MGYTKAKKREKSEDMSFSLPSWCCLFLRFERQKCSSDNPVSSSHFLPEMALSASPLGAVSRVCALHGSLWATDIWFFVLFLLCLGFDQVTLQVGGGVGRTCKWASSNLRSAALCPCAGCSFPFWCLCRCFRLYIKKKKKVFIGTHYLTWDGVMLLCCILYIQ